MRQTLEQQEKSLKWFMKNRWWLTAMYVFWVIVHTQEIFQKHTQWPFILWLSLPPGVPIWHSIWENIFGVALFSFLLVSSWVRVYNYRRGQSLAEQTALQKVTKPPEGVWPPPPL